MKERGFPKKLRTLNIRYLIFHLRSLVPEEKELDVFPVNERVGTETSLGRLILVALFKLALEKLPPHCANSGSESSVMEPKVDRVTFPPTFSNLGNDRVSILVYFSICILHRT